MTRKKVMILAMTAMVAVFGVAGCKKKGNTVEENVLIIGGQNPETGAMADYGSKTVLGAQIAIDEINANGGINGKKIKFLHYDSRGEKTEAVNLTRRLVKEDACAIIGEITSGGFLAMKEIANEGGIVAISTGGTAEHITERRLADGKFERIPFAFRNTLQDSEGAPALIKFLVENKKITNYALITSNNNDYSVGLSQFFRKAIKNAGAKILIEESINDGDTDVSAQITQIKKKSDVQAVIYTGYYQEAAYLLMAMKVQGLKVPLVGGDGFQSPDLWKIAGEDAIGAIFYSGYSADSERQQVKDFDKKMVAAGKGSDTFSAQGYDAAYLLANAMKVANVTDCSKESRDKIRQALQNTKDFEGVTGVMSIDETGSAVRTPFLLEVVLKENKEFGTKIIGE